jgi:BirA family transcriptional regulator, biotin operon repressor / biotin---[acetyl-CoA-carboxylase] ligase
MGATGGQAPTLPSPFILVAHDCVGSTSDEAKTLASAGAQHGTLVWALEQTGGRGRLDRRWISPRGNLFTSIVLRPEAPPAQAAELGFVAALAVAEAVERFVSGSDRVRLKWPNDVLADGAKIAGILLEARSASSGLVDWVVLGIGINIVAAPSGTPYPATCLAQLTIAVPPVEEVLEALAESLALWLSIWENRGFSPIRDAWLGKAHGLGDPLRVRQGEDELSGRFLDLDLDGALVLETASGIRRITAGDVYFPAV